MEPIAQLAASPEAWAALATLIVLELVLGIDNLIFISILTNRLPEAQRPRARMVGISAALVLRLALLSLIFVIVGLTAPVFSALGHAFSWRDLILIAGGLFLVWKATTEIHHNVDPDGGDTKGPASVSGFAMVIGQILLLDCSAARVTRAKHRNCFLNWLRLILRVWVQVLRGFRLTNSRASRRPGNATSFATHCAIRVCRRRPLCS